MMEHLEKEEWQKKTILWNLLSFWEDEKNNFFFPSFYFYILFPPFFKIPTLSYLERLLRDWRQLLAENTILFGQVAH